MKKVQNVIFALKLFGLVRNTNGILHYFLHFCLTTDGPSRGTTSYQRLRGMRMLTMMSNDETIIFFLNCVCRVAYEINSSHYEFFIHHQQLDKVTSALVSSLEELKRRSLELVDTLDMAISKPPSGFRCFCFFAMDFERRKIFAGFAHTWPVSAVWADPSTSCRRKLPPSKLRSHHCAHTLTHSMHMQETLRNNGLSSRIYCVI